MFRTSAVAVSVVLYFGAACVLVPPIVAPIVDAWEEISGEDSSRRRPSSAWQYVAGVTEPHDEIEVDVAFGGKDRRPTLELAAAEQVFAELRADRDRWRERAERAERRLRELGDDTPAE